MTLPSALTERTGSTHLQVPALLLHSSIHMQGRTALASYPNRLHRAEQGSLGGWGWGAQPASLNPKRWSLWLLFLVVVACRQQERFLSAGLCLIAINGTWGQSPRSLDSQPQRYFLWFIICMQLRAAGKATVSMLSMLEWLAVVVFQVWSS